MKYYDEETMKAIRLKLELDVLRWPEVTTKKMYGCPCYKRQEKLFAFLVTQGVVLVHAPDDDKARLSDEFDVKPFQINAKRSMNKWPQITITQPTDLKRILPYIKRSYDHVQP